MWVIKSGILRMILLLIYVALRTWQKAQSTHCHWSFEIISRVINASSICKIHYTVLWQREGRRENSWVHFQWLFIKTPKSDVSGCTRGPGSSAKKVTSDIIGADRHVARVPGEGNLNTKLIKTAKKPWLLGHIKPKKCWGRESRVDL